MKTAKLCGNFPILATAFTDAEEFDAGSQRRLIDYMIDAGVHGLVTLANASEGFALSDAEKREVAELVVKHTAGRVPVVVTISHPSTKVTVENAKWAESVGADALLVLPPFFGAWTADAGGIYQHFAKISDNVKLPMIIQDHPLAGGTLSTPLLVRMAQEIENVKYYKIESARAALKIRDVLSQAGEHLDGIFGGAAGITFLEELDQGACGTMPSSSFPDPFSRIYNAYAAGNRDEASRLFGQYAQFIAFEWELGGRHVAKKLLHEAGIIDSPALRAPIGMGWDDKFYDHMMKLARQSDLRLMKYVKA
jgi:dihydrodipicolinate synthase/N-acetylneuraminate lyase